MAGVHLVVDSAAALPRGAVQNLALSMVTHGAVVDQRPYHGTDLVDPAFFDALRSATTPPVVRRPTAEEFLDVFQRVLGWGVDVVSLHPSSKLSDSSAAARAAAGRLPAGAPLSIVETPWCSSALGLIAIRAAEAGIDDWPRADVLALIDAIAARLSLVGVSGDPAYLDRWGGLARVSGDSAAAADSRQIDATAGTGPHVAAADRRQVFEYRDGEINTLMHAADLGEALRRLAAEVTARVDPSTSSRLGFFSAGADAEAAAIATFLEGRLRPAEIWIAPCDPVLARLIGPGGFGVAFYAD